MDKQRKDKRGLIIPKWIIYFVKILGFLNSYLCMRFAGYLWTRPIKYKVPEREIPILKSCNTSILKIKSINKKIQFYRWKGKGPKVLLVHGWSGRASNMFCIIERLIEKDYDIYSFDAPAHGNSPSKTTNIPEFIACINELHLHIKSIDARGKYSDGMLQIDDIRIRTELLQADGFGKIIPDNESLSISAISTIADDTVTKEKFGEYYPTYLANTEVPILISGNFKRPEIDVKISDVITQKIQQEIKNKAIESIKDKIKDKIESDINIKLPF